MCLRIRVSLSPSLPDHAGSEYCAFSGVQGEHRMSRAVPRVGFVSGVPVIRVFHIDTTQRRLRPAALGGGGRRVIISVCLSVENARTVLEKEGWC